MTRKIDSLGRIVIPKTLRDILDINTGDELEVLLIEDCIILRKKKDKERKKSREDED